MTRLEFINWFYVRFVLTKNDIYELGQLYDEVTKPHWISVEDELPPYKDENKKHSIEVLGWYGENMVDRIYYDYGDEMWFDSFFYRNPPTHWMPLPQAPTVAENATVKKGGEHDTEE